MISAFLNAGGGIFDPFLKVANCSAQSLTLVVQGSAGGHGLGYEPVASHGCREVGIPSERALYRISRIVDMALVIADKSFADRVSILD